jgi:hypothetical protein
LQPRAAGRRGPWEESIFMKLIIFVVAEYANTAEGGKLNVRSNNWVDDAFPNYHHLQSVIL